jgi:hypothetical protein
MKRKELLGREMNIDEVVGRERKRKEERGGRGRKIKEEE